MSKEADGPKEEAGGRRNSTDSAANPTSLTSRLTEQLIEENRALLETLTRCKSHFQSEQARCKKEAGAILSRLVSDNAFYRRENEKLGSRLAHLEKNEAKTVNTVKDLTNQKQELAHQNRILSRLVSTLRQQKIDLEFQAKNLGAAFLTIREIAIKFLVNPVSLEAGAAPFIAPEPIEAEKDHAWRAKAASESFKAAVIETIRMTHALQEIIGKVDQRLVGLRLLDPATAISLAKGERSAKLTLEMLGERLVPVQELEKAKKERRAVARRLQLCQTEVSNLKTEVENLAKEVENKNALIQKGAAKKAVCQTSQAFCATLRAENQRLREELTALTQKLAKRSSSRDFVKQEKSVKKAPPSPAAPLLDPTLARSAAFFGSGPSMSPSRQRTVRSPSRQLRAAPIPAPPPPSSAPQSNIASPPAGFRIPIPATAPSSVPAFSGAGISLAPSRSRARSSSSIKDAPSVGMERPPSSAGGRRSIGTTVAQQTEFLSPFAREVEALQAHGTSSAPQPSPAEMVPPSARRPSFSDFLSPAPPPSNGPVRRTVPSFVKESERVEEDASVAPERRPSGLGLALRQRRSLSVMERGASELRSPASPLLERRTSRPEAKSFFAPPPASSAPTPVAPSPVSAEASAPGPPQFSSQQEHSRTPESPPCRPNPSNSLDEVCRRVSSLGEQVSSSQLSEILRLLA